MASWNIADVWDVCAEVRGDAPAQIHGNRRISWSELDQRANGLARTLLDAGVGQQDKVAQYLFNCPEYMQGVYACFKAGLVPVNTNYRYADAELLYLWDNADAVAVMFHATFVPTIERIRDQLPKVRLWLWVDDDSHPCPDWAVDWEQACATPTSVTGPWGRSGDDRWFLYTGGTTGMPKGVMWDQDTLVRIMTKTLQVPVEDHTTMAQFRQFLIGCSQPVILPGAPLMHGTGHLTTLGQLTAGGTMVTMESRSLDAEAMLQACHDHRVNMLVIVGDAFARPLLDALGANPGRWDLSSMVTMVSSGVMWSQPIKERLLEHIPQMVIFDSLGSSEAVGMGASYSTKDNISSTARFELGPSAVVLTEDGRRVEPGSGEIGRLGITGLMPVGYYKDEVKTAATFPVIDGVRYSLPGDWATVEADGTITLLGRGSVCINTGGEKVFPEEVEEVLKTHPGIVDAVCVGVPDERFGQAICAIVEPRAGVTLRDDDVIDHVKGSLASYKAPRIVLVKDTIGRAPNAKVDYKGLNTWAREQLAPTG